MDHFHFHFHNQPCGWLPAGRRSAARSDECGLGAPDVRINSGACAPPGDFIANYQKALSPSVNSTFCAILKKLEMVILVLIWKLPNLSRILNPKKNCRAVSPNSVIVIYMIYDIETFGKIKDQKWITFTNFIRFTTNLRKSYTRTSLPTTRAQHVQD